MFECSKQNIIFKMPWSVFQLRKKYVQSTVRCLVILRGLVLPKTTILKESVKVKPGVLLLRKLLVPSNLLILVADQGQLNYILSHIRKK